MLTQTLPKRAFVEQIMGLPVSIHVRGPEVRSAMVEEVVDRAFRRLRWIDSVFSTYEPNSPVSRLRRGEVELDQLTGAVGYIADVCAAAQEITGGAFDAYLPDADGTLRFDPSGAVKGWAIGQAAAILDSLTGHSYCVNAGGDLHAGGAEHEPWHVGVQDPAQPDIIARTVALGHGGLATSGRYARGNHLIDPRTGQPVDRAGSVTVVGPDILWADVWATALFVGDQDTLARFHDWDSRYDLITLP
ncbi:FAD:protein FMN transferase [Calidifontibacter terrae]